MSVTLEPMLIDPMERQALKSLGDLPRNLGLIAPGLNDENKYWFRAVDSLVAKGFAENIFGCYTITDAGRSQLRSNLSE